MLKDQHGNIIAYRYSCRCDQCCETRLMYGRNASLTRRYGLKFADIEKMIETQGGKCPICLQALGEYGMKAGRGKGGGGNVHIDHDHETGKLRGVLCRSCNQGLGKFKDDQTALDRAASYVRNCGIISAGETHEQQQVEG